MKRLWAPWRYEYVTKSENGDKGCFLCDNLKKNKDDETYIVKRGERCFVILNLYPYNNAHLLVSPNRHIECLEEMNDEESLELFGLTRSSMNALKKAYNPDGFNIGINIGMSAGAGESHIHQHIVPRWDGDTNFMPVLGGTKVMIEDLNSTYARVKEALNEQD